MPRPSLTVWTTAFALAVCDTGTALAEPDLLRSSLVTDFEAGVLCETETAARMSAPGTSLGSIGQFLREPEFDLATSVVPAAPGIAFGVKARAATDGVIDAVVTVTHPPYPDGTTIEFWDTAINHFDTTTNVFIFEYPWEMQLGTWRIEVTSQGRHLYGATFEVVAPEHAEWILDACRREGDDALMS